MPTFQCKKCDKKVEAAYEGCHCTHSHNCHEQKSPLCCGQPMLEIMDDWIKDAIEIFSTADEAVQNAA